MARRGARGRSVEPHFCAAEARDSRSLRQREDAALSLARAHNPTPPLSHTTYPSTAHEDQGQGGQEAEAGHVCVCDEGVEGKRMECVRQPISETKDTRTPCPALLCTVRSGLTRHNTFVNTTPPSSSFS